MITSNTPWSVRQTPGKGAEILNVSGDVIGVMLDWRDAELIISNMEEIEKLNEEIQELESLNEELECKLKS